jgi:hypothetical protein
MPPDVPRPDWYDDIVTTYDTIAEQYATDYFDELARKPFDRELLTKFADLMPYDFEYQSRRAYILARKPE